MNLTRTHLYALILTASIIWSMGTVSVHAAVTNASPTDSLTRGLVGYWTFDGKDTNWTSNTTLDRSGNGNTGTLLNMSTTTSPVIGKVGQGLIFDGNNDVIDAGSGTSLDDIQNQGGGGMTVSFWINPTTNTTKTIMAKGSASNGSGTWQISKTSATSPARLSFSKEGGTDSGKNYNSLLVSGVWQHIVLTWNGSMTVSTGVLLYKNAVLQVNVTGTDGATANSEASYPLCVGNTASAVSGCITTGSSDMKIDDIRIYNRILSTSEITQLYNMGATKYAVSPTVTATSTCSVGLSCGLVGYWTFDGKDTPWTSSSAATTVDRSGNGGTGTLRGMSQSISPALGKVGQALNFRANVGEYVEVADNDRYSFGNGTSDTPFSLSAWIYYGGIDAAFTGWPIISKWNNTSPAIAEWGFYVSGTNVVGSGASGGLTLQINSGGGVTNRFVVEGRTSLVAGRWYHVMATYDGSSTSSGIKLYLNNAQDTTDVQSDGTYTAMSNLSSTVDIGGMIRSNATFDSFAKGKIDDVRIYNRILSTSEITQLYNMSATKYAVSPTVTATSTCSVGLSCGLTGYWTFDGKDTDWSTNTSNDKSGNGHHAKFISMSTTTSPIRGPVGQAIKAASTTAEYVDYQVTPASLMSNATGTMALWMYTYTPVVGNNCITNGSGNVIFSDGLAGGGGNVWIGYGTSGICVGLYTGSNITMATSNFPKNRWVHVAWVHQNGTLSYYINGQLVNSTAAGNVSAMTIGMTSGRGYGGIYNPAYVDDVRTYNRGLSASEIQQLYNMGR